MSALPLNIEVRVREAQSAFSGKDFESAIAGCRRALDAFQQLPQAERFNRTSLLVRILLMRCDAFLAIDNCLSALEDALECCSQDASDAAGFYRTGIILRKMRRFDEAKAYLGVAVSLSKGTHIQAKLQLTAVETDLRVSKGSGKLTAAQVEEFGKIRIPPLSFYYSMALKAKGPNVAAVFDVQANASSNPIPSGPELPPPQKPLLNNAARNAVEEEFVPAKQEDEKAAVDTTKPEAAATVKTGSVAQAPREEFIPYLRRCSKGLVDRVRDAGPCYLAQLKTVDVRKTARSLRSTSLREIADRLVCLLSLPGVFLFMSLALSVLYELAVPGYATALRLLTVAGAVHHLHAREERAGPIRLGSVPLTVYTAAALSLAMHSEFFRWLASTAGAEASPV